MAVDMFLKLKDVKGEAQDKTHKDEIDVLAWSWGMSQSGTMHMGPGGGSGKVSVQDLSVTKYVDKSSPTLMRLCSQGDNFGEAILTVRKAGGKDPVEYIVITMTDCIVTSISTGGSGGEDRLTENVSINFGAVKTEYQPQKPDGSGDAKISWEYDIAANEQK